MKVLFTHSFFLAFDEKQEQSGDIYPPLGTLIAAAMARDAGHDVALYDSTFEQGPAPSFAEVVARELPQAVVVFDDNFHWLSKMCLARMRNAAHAMICVAAKGAKVMVAGSDASDDPTCYLEAGANCVVTGEAEFHMLEILGAWSQGQATPVLPGVVISGNTDRMQKKRGERDLSRFPRAAWDLVDMTPYRRRWLEQNKPFSLNMTTTRGCPYQCNWCAKPIHGRRYDVRSAEDCAREIAFLVSQYGAQHIWFTDDIFGLKPGWVANYADACAELNMHVPYKIQARADMMSPTLVRELGRSGCAEVWMGVESGSQRILDAMQKDLKVDQSISACVLLREAGIRVGFFLQFGYPGEEASDIQATWEMVEKARPDQIGISVSYPLPGTPFHEKVAHELEEHDHWDHSNYMMPLHKATYPKHFYPALFYYFHECFNLLQKKQPLERVKTWVRYLEARHQLRRFGVDGVSFR